MADSNGSATKSAPSLHAPNNLDAERAVLGSILLDNEIIPEVIHEVEQGEFYLPAHQTIFQGMIELYDSGQPVDLNLLMDWLRKKGKLDEVGGMVAVASLEQYVLSTGAAPELAGVVREKAMLRKLMSAADTILRDCADEKREVEQQIEFAEKLIYEIGQGQTTADFVAIKDLMGDAIEEIGHLRAQKEDISGIPTGYPDLDGLLNGLHPSDLLILAARPSIGKTAFALNLCLNISFDRKIPVGVFSLEMGREQINMRLLCTHAKISSQKVRRGIIKEAEFKLLRAKAGELMDCPVYIDDSAALSILQVRARARRLKAQQPDLGLIIVDYLQLMNAGERRGREVNRQQEVSEISRGLKALAREIEVPVLALSQLSRNIEQRSGKDKSATPMLSDLRESGSIEQDADVVMFVHRERVEVQKEEDGQPVDRSAPIPTEIIVGKHRNGPIGTADLMFWPDFTRFTSRA